MTVGPSSNVAGTLLAYGWAVSDAGYFLVFVSVGILTLADFLRTFQREEAVG